MMIELQQIHKSFGNLEVLKGIDLKVSKGENQVLLGLSGSGKTTLLKLINALLLPDAGKVFFEEKNLNSLKLLEIRRKMGYVIQQGGLFPHYTVYQNIAVVPHLLKWEEEKIRQRVTEILEKLHLNPGEFSNKYPSELSGGQQQRVGLARALASGPAVLLMDEPFGALDPITRQSIRREFLELDELRETTIILVTHDVQEAFELGDRIGIMQGGKILQNDSPANILGNPANNFVRNFIKNELLVLELKNQDLYEPLNQALSSGKLSLKDLKKFIADE